MCQLVNVYLVDNTLVYIGIKSVRGIIPLSGNKKMIIKYLDSTVALDRVEEHEINLLNWNLMHVTPLLKKNMLWLSL